MIEYKGHSYYNGICEFTPKDNHGSFRIATPIGLEAELDIASVREGKVTLFDRKKNIPLGDSVYELSRGKYGCWFNAIDLNQTTICAANLDASVDYSPHHIGVPSNTPAWGERQGMNTRIISKSGLDTAHAVMVLEKNREGAYEWCRVNGDFSKKCITQTLSDNTGPARRKSTISANCISKIYTDYYGRKFKYLGQDQIFDIVNHIPFEISGASSGTVAMSAIRALCPNTLERGTSVK